MGKRIIKSSNEELLKEFEKRRKFSLSEWQEYIKKQSLTESENNQILEVDNIFEYMDSLGYSTLDGIKDKYSL